MNTVLCLLLVGIVTIVALAVPPTPTFPTTFTTSFDFQSPDNRTNNVGTWDYSLAAKSERFVHHYQGAEINILRRYDQQKQYHVEINFGYDPICFESAITGDLDYPSFNGYTYYGNFHHHGEAVDMWKEVKGKETYRYYGYKTSEIPFELSAESTSLTFTDFKKVDQLSTFEPPSNCHTFANHKAAIYARHPELCSVNTRLLCSAYVAKCGVECCLGTCSSDYSCANCMRANKECVACF
eukprot:TRINITY_DN2400_c0_g1_i3.p1 TRINITY_DN2400_c0_g1~~TRINITY_DN2400_c0_g1_i3.p1  ORF type:complete len:269 (+),score=44.65 TRINITY_DN2400_c0_g1_i3:93-809(+)